MLGRKSAKQSKELLEHLARAQSDHLKNRFDQATVVDEKNAALQAAKDRLESLLLDALNRDSYISLDSLKRSPGLGAFAGDALAIANYFELVLDSSAYPSGFPKQPDITYAAESKEIRVEFSLPTPDVIPDTWRYAYDEIRDEIFPVTLSNKRRRRLYASMLAQICLRVVHEIFIADRTETVDRIDFSGYANGINQSTGQEGSFCLVALSITRLQFESLDLRRVEPLACLKGLGARLSSKPDQLLAVSPIAQTDLNDAGDGAQAGQPASDLQDRVEAQANHIAEMKRKLDAYREQIAKLQPDLRDTQERNAQLQSALEKEKNAAAKQVEQQNVQTTRLAVLVTELRDERERNAELQNELEAAENYIADLERLLAAAKGDIAERDYAASGDLEDTQPIEPAGETTADSDFEGTEMFAPITTATPDDSAGGVPVPPRTKQARDAGKSVSLRSLLEATGAAVADASVYDEPGSGSTELARRSELSQRDALMDIVGSPQSDSARLLALFMDNKWRISATALVAEFPGEFVNVIVDDINERANDSISENLIFYDFNELAVYDDYCHDIESIISLPEYQTLRHSKR